MSKVVAAICFAIICSAFAPRQVAAQDIALTSRDGNVQIQGRFLGYNGEFYRVESEFGVLTVDASGVNCEGPACPDLQNYVARLRFSGDPWALDSLLRPLISDFARAKDYAVSYEETADGTRAEIRDLQDILVGEFELFNTSDTEALSDVMRERADVAVTLREATTEEVDLALNAGVGDFGDPIRARVLALDALSPVVNVRNPVTSLSLDELAGILSAEIDNWAEVGGADAPIQRHLRVEDAASSDVTILGDALSGSVAQHETVSALVTAVEDDPYAIGLALVSAGGGVKIVGLSGSCGFSAAAAAVDIKTEDYPLVRPIFLYTPARRLSALGREFMAYALSESAQPVIAETGFVDQAIERVTFRDQGRRFANAITQAGSEIGLEELQEATSLLQGAERLTLGFRFEGGSTRLDAQSRSNTRKLAEILEAGLYDGKTVSFVGFSDGRGSASVNETLSKRRADSVLRAVLSAVGESFEADRVTLTTHGVGEAMPLACDDSAWGRALNRRVEVWVRD